MNSELPVGFFTAHLARLLLLVLLPITAANAAPDAPLPQSDGARHLGVVTCAGSTCHGATQPFEDSPVLQNEFITWHQKDQHAEAYKVLLNDQSKAIARNLGLEAAHTADICLDCHADNVPDDRRGKRFQMSDGVACEACHGGSEKWLGPHVSGENSHQDNLDMGMYPTEDPVARGKLCLSCHFGNDDKFVTHRIMGAGHPRMSFELDTFTQIEPAHFVVDQDYTERKPNAQNGAALWATGQLIQAENYLDAFLDEKKHQSGLFPELVFFDCHACHHPMSDRRWTPRAGVGLGPGVVRLNDSSLIMLEHIARRVSPDDADKLVEYTRNLHLATTKGLAPSREAATQLRDLVRSLAGQAMTHSYAAGDLQDMMRSIVERGVQGEYRDYAGAEQGVMAIGSIVATLERSGAVKDDALARVTSALDGLYAALSSDEEFRPAAFATAWKSLGQALP